MLVHRLSHCSVEFSSSEQVGVVALSIIMYSPCCLGYSISVKTYALVFLPSRLRLLHSLYNKGVFLL